MESKITEEEATISSSSSSSASRKRNRWWNHYNGTEALELQPLQQKHQTPIDGLAKTTTGGRDTKEQQQQTTTVYTAPAGTLERILGLDEPIVQRRTHDRCSTRCASTATTSFLHNYFYPQNVPHEIQLWRLENICIPACYLTVGILQGTVRPLLNVYPIDLGATEAQQTTLASIAMLPSAFKIVFGFLSDTVPINGFRRKPYLLFAWLMISTFMALLLSTADLTLPLSNDSVVTATENLIPRELDSSTAVITRRNNDNHRPSMEWLMLVFFVAGCGIWMADAMVDSFVAQKARLETPQTQGTLQSTCYAFRFFGLAMAAPMSTYLYSHIGNGQGPVVIVCIIMATPIALALPSLYLLAEDRNETVPSVVDQCYEIWKTVCSRAVWQPIGFVYLFNVLQIPNAAWRQYLKSVQGFTASQLIVLLTASYIMLYGGVMMYKYCCLQMSWRRIFQICIVITGLFSCGQLALIRGYTAGLSPFVFALGDDSIAEFVYGIQMLPVAMLMVRLCPVHSEGASYAMFTTTWNSAMMLAQAIGSSSLLGIWDTSKETMVSGNLNGLFRLSMLTTAIKVSPILVVHWFPHGREELDALLNETGSKLGGGLFLLIVLGSVLYSVVVALLNVLRPGWAGES